VRVLFSLREMTRAETTKATEAIVARWAALALPLALLTPGCGSTHEQEPFSASRPDPGATAAGGVVRAGSVQAAVSVVNGDTEQAVSGAQVTVSGRPFTSDGAGTFAAPDPTLPDAPVEIAAGGFLKRETLMRTDARFTLWPERGDFPASFTQEMVYNPAFIQDGKLSRPAGGVFIVFGSGIEGDAQAAIREAASLLTAASGGRIPFTVGAGSPTITVSVDPSAAFFAQNPGAAAFALVPFVGNVLGGADGKLTFKEAGFARIKSLAAHELGHHYGLGHPTGQPAIMNATVDPGRSDYTSAEKLAIKMMALRRPGNAFPDNDRAVVGASARRGVAVFGCGLLNQ
jgi:hypothetical protein